MRKRIFALLAILLAVVLIWGYNKYRTHTNANVPKQLDDPYLYIPTGTDLQGLLDRLSEGGFLKDVDSFEEYAQVRQFTDEKVQPGRYKIEPGWSNHDLMLMLILGNQATLNMTINNAREITDLAGQAARYIEADSLQILSYLLSDEAKTKYKYTRDNALTMFIPNTYNVYWTSTPTAFAERMHKEHQRFWDSNNRLKKAEAKGLSPKEVYTLASIVEKETRLNKEKPIVAGLYLNRLKRGMLLQADPTAVFATREFGARRVLNRHINFDSPYNTYKYAGLPPGPITMPSIQAIDAVLNPARHEYIFMCAKPGYSGEHAFARTSQGHAQNANRYRRWLNKEGIMK